MSELQQDSCDELDVPGEESCQERSIEFKVLNLDRKGAHDQMVK